MTRTARCRSCCRAGKSQLERKSDERHNRGEPTIGKEVFRTSHGGRPTNRCGVGRSEFRRRRFLCQPRHRIWQIETDYPEVFTNEECMRGYDPGAYPPPGVWPHESEWDVCELTGRPLPPWMKFDVTGRPIPPLAQVIVRYRGHHRRGVFFSHLKETP